MKRTKEEIIKALHVIQDTCKELTYRSCKICPFSNKEGTCLVTKDIPFDWIIKKDDEHWRAFE